MKRLVAFIVMVALTVTLSAAPSYRSSVRPLVYMGDDIKPTPVCTVVQVEEWPSHWLGAGHCYHDKGIWLQIAPGVHQFKAAYPTIDGHRAIPVVVNIDWTDAAVYYTPGYDTVGVNLYHGKLKAGDSVLIPGYQKGRNYIQAPGVIEDIPFDATFAYSDGPKNRVGFTTDHGDLPKDQRPTFGNSGSPVIKDGRIAGIHIGSGIRNDGTEQSFGLPLDQLYKAMKGHK